MKQVNLSGPAVIAGAVRYPIEGTLIVTDDQAEQLRASNLLDGEPEDLPSDEPADDKHVEDEDPGDGLDDEKVADLKALAEREQIDLGRATAKPDIIAAIRAAREAKEG